MEYHVEHILLPVETPAENDSVKTAAESLAKRARDGENFSSLAASFSRADDAMKGGDLGWRSLNDLPATFAEALRANSTRVPSTLSLRSVPGTFSSSKTNATVFKRS